MHWETTLFTGASLTIAQVIWSSNVKCDGKPLNPGMIFLFFPIFFRRLISEPFAAEPRANNRSNDVHSLEFCGQTAELWDSFFRYMQARQSTETAQ